MEDHLCKKHIMERPLFQYQMRKKTFCHERNPRIINRRVTVSPDTQKHQPVQTEHKGLQVCRNAVAAVLYRKHKGSNKSAAHKFHTHGNHRFPDIPGEQFQQVPGVLDCAKEANAEHQLRERTLTLSCHKNDKTKASQNRKNL